MRVRLWIVALATVSAMPACAPEPAGDPNVLFLVIDALRPRHVSGLGYQRKTTPNLDELMKEGVVFSDATSPSSYTRAAVPSIFVSVMPTEHRVRTQGDAVDPLPDHYTTLAELLKERGYATAAFMPNPSLDRAYNFDQGFDHYDDDFQLGRPGTTRSEGNETARRIRKRSLAWLDEQDRQPWFLYLHYRDVHGPYVPPPPYHEAFWDPDGPKTPITEAQAEARHRYLDLRRGEQVLEFYLSQYDGEILYTDHQIQKLLDRLDDRGMLENTLIVVTADHGESFLEHGTWDHGTGLYQEELHVPLYLIVPGERGEGWRGRRIDVPVQTSDLLPTLVELLDLPAPDGMMGPSLVEAIEGRADPERLIFADGDIGRGGWVGMIREGPWKLIHDPPRGRTELYDLSRDPGEQRDLAAAEPERAARLRERLEAQWRENEARAEARGAAARTTLEPDVVEGPAGRRRSRGQNHQQEFAAHAGLPREPGTGRRFSSLVTSPWPTWLWPLRSSMPVTPNTPLTLPSGPSSPHWSNGSRRTVPWLRCWKPKQPHSAVSRAPTRFPSPAGS